MRPLAYDLPRMKDVQAATMWDSCQVGAYTETVNELNEPEVSYSWGAAQKCAYSPEKGTERRKPELTALEYDAVLRLPLGAVLTARDHVRIIARHGTPITPIEYGVLSEPLAAATVQVVYLQEVEP